MDGWRSSRTPTIVRPNARPHSIKPLAVTTPISNRASFGWASGKTVIPPRTFPTLANSTQLAFAEPWSVVDRDAHACSHRRGVSPP